MSLLLTRLNTPQDPQSFLEEDGIKLPLLFISFPSAKDPNWDKEFPERSTCEIVTVGPWEWFKRWADAEDPFHRGDEYDRLKTAVGRAMWQQVVEMFPHLRTRVECFEIGSPLSNYDYLSAPQGELYGANHNMARFSAENAALLRPQTPIEGLFLTGQDIFSCGFVGAMYGGLLCASTVLHRQLLLDLTLAFSKHGRKRSKAEPDKKAK